LPLAANAYGQEVPKDVLKHIRAVSVSIEWEGRTRASGVIFHKEGETYCLTANHVVDAAGDRQIRVVQHSTGKVVSINAEIHRQDEEHDYAILKLGKGVFTEGAKVCCKKPGLDTPVVHCGSMRGFDHTVTRGYINGLDRELGHGQRDQVDLTADMGRSGGGVFTTQGELIGIVTQGHPQRLVFFVPVRRMEGLK